MEKEKTLLFFSGSDMFPNEIPYAPKNLTFLSSNRVSFPRGNEKAPSIFLSFEPETKQYLCGIFFTTSLTNYQIIKRIRALFCECLIDFHFFKGFGPICVIFFEKFLPLASARET